MVCAQWSAARFVSVLPTLSALLVPDAVLVKGLGTLVLRAVAGGDWSAVAAVATTLSPRHRDAAWDYVEETLSRAPFTAEHGTAARVAFGVTAAPPFA